MKRYFDCFGDEVTAADEDDCTAPKFLRNLRKHPDPRDPDSVLADADWAEAEEEAEEDQDTVEINEEPIPYTSNKEA